MTPDFLAVEDFVNRLIAEVPLAGAALLIAREGELIYERAFGAYSLDLQLPIMSATKWVSAAVIATLIDDGTLHLDERAGDYIEALDGDKATVTLRHLLAHTSGLHQGESPCVDQPGATLAACADAIAQAPLVARPGTTFIYGEDGFQVAGRMAEIATGRAWDELFRERLADPLGMTATDYAFRSKERAYVRVSNPRLGSGLRSTLRDYAAFARMIADGGAHAGRRILSAAALAAMAEDQTFGAPISFSPNLVARAGYGLGCWRDEADAAGRAIQLSSPGAYGYTPWVDARLGLAGVFVARNTYARLARPVRQLQELVRAAVNRER